MKTSENALAQDQWHLVHYHKDFYKAFVGLGMTPESDQEIYTVTIIDSGQQEHYSRDFTNSSEALSHLSQKCRGWKKKDLREKEGSGCTSCVAH